MEIVSYQPSQQPNLQSSKNRVVATHLVANQQCQRCLPAGLLPNPPCLPYQPAIAHGPVMAINSSEIQPTTNPSELPAFFGYSILSAHLSHVSQNAVRRILHSALFNYKETGNPVSFHLTPCELLVRALELIHPPNIGTNVAIGYEIIDVVYVDPFVPELLSIICLEQKQSQRRIMLTYMLASYDARGLQSALNVYMTANGAPPRKSIDSRKPFLYASPLEATEYTLDRKTLRSAAVHRHNSSPIPVVPGEQVKQNWPCLRTIGTTGAKNALMRRSLLHGNTKKYSREAAHRSRQRTLRPSDFKEHSITQKHGSCRRSRYETQQAPSMSSSSTTASKGGSYKESKLHEMKNHSVSLSPMLREKGRLHSYKHRSKSRSSPNHHKTVTKSLSELSLSQGIDRTTDHRRTAPVEPPIAVAIPRFGGIYNRYIPKANVPPLPAEPPRSPNCAQRRPPSQQRRTLDNTKSSRSSDSAFEHMPQSTQWKDGVSVGRRAVHRPAAAHHSKRRSPAPRIKSSDEVLQEILEEVKTVKKHVHALKAERMSSSYRPSETDDDVTAMKSTSQSSKKKSTSTSLHNTKKQRSSDIEKGKWIPR